MLETKTYPMIPYHFDEDEKNTRVYSDLQRLLGFEETPTNNGLSNGDFQEGNCLMGFNTSRDGQPLSNVSGAPMEGTLSFYARFQPAITGQPVQLVFMLVCCIYIC